MFLTVGHSVRRVSATNRRSLLGGLLLILVLTAGCGEDGPGGGGKRVVDARAGLSYSLPFGWEEKPRDDLLDFFTSASGRQTDADVNGGLLLLGSTDGLSAEELPDLATMAEGLAASFAEFFVPFPGEREKTGDKEVEVAGVEAHRVVLEITPDDAPPALVEAVVIDLEDGPAYALGIVTPREVGLERQITEALDSLDVAG